MGDIVQIVDIAPDLKSRNYPHEELRTAELFRFCLGRRFRIHGFDKYGFPELQVSEDRLVARRFGKWHSIWVEPQFLNLIQKGRHQLRRAAGLGWQIDFWKSEREFEKQQRELDRLAGKAETSINRGRESKRKRRTN